MLIQESGRAPHRTRVGQDADRASDPDGLLSCFAGLDLARGLLLAVSGGPDSMAMLLLAVRWRERLGGDAPRIHVATVDHGLRAESRAEAELVAGICADLDLPHTILAWTGLKPTTSVQERARKARYALFADHARAVGATHVVTAHHADDQAETVLMRLARGSGVAGLAGMRRVTHPSHDICLVRPFLDVTKADLMAICRAEACAYVDDPTNRDPTFARARLRANRRALADLGLDTSGLGRLARRMTRADAAIEAEVDRIEALIAPQRSEAAFRADMTGVREIAAEFAVRLLGRAVGRVSDQPIRLERLETLAEAIWGALEAGKMHRGTIAGTRVVLDRDGVLTISEEPPRRRGRVQDVSI